MAETVRYHYGTGRRKTAVARVRLYPGDGGFTVNGKQMRDFFGGRQAHHMAVESPLRLTNTLGTYNIVATVRGGGVSGQAGAVRHGISTALTRYEPELRTTVKREGFLTRDPRVVERKKYGKAKARRSFQFSKR